MQQQQQQQQQGGGRRRAQRQRRRQRRRAQRGGTSGSWLAADEDDEEEPEEAFAVAYDDAAANAAADAEADEEADEAGGLWLLLEVWNRNALLEDDLLGRARLDLSCCCSGAHRWGWVVAHLPGCLDSCAPHARAAHRSCRSG